MCQLKILGSNKVFQYILAAMFPTKPIPRPVNVPTNGTLVPSWISGMEQAHFGRKAATNRAI
jgi:hypothetical protein